MFSQYHASGDGGKLLIPGHRRKLSSPMRLASESLHITFAIPYSGIKFTPFAFAAQGARSKA
jgi:hypothetical protein